MAASLVPRIIVLALGAGALGFPDALGFLLDIAGRRGPLNDVAICAFAMAVVTTQALGAMLLARFVRKAARAGGDDARAPGAPTRTDRFAEMTLVVSVGVGFLVSACLLVASGAGAGCLGLLHLVADVARKSPVIEALATGAAVLPCGTPLLRVFRREEDHSHGPTAAAAASSSTGTGRFANMTLQVASFTGVAAVVGTMLLFAHSTFTRRARNAAGAGGRAAPTPAADTRRVGSKLRRLAPYLAVVSFVALLCCFVLTMDAPLESGLDGATYP